MDGVLQGGVIFNLLPNGVDMTKNGPPDTDQLLDLVGNLYASALDPSAATAALDALCSSLGSSATQIYTYDKGSGMVLASQTNDVINEERNDQYIRHWGALDPRPVALASLPSGGIIRCHESFDEKYVARSSFYQDFFIPNGFRWPNGACLIRETEPLPLSQGYGTRMPPHSNPGQRSCWPSCCRTTGARQTCTGKCCRSAPTPWMWRVSSRRFPPRASWWTCRVVCCS